MADARYATFITLDDTGHPQARMVDPFEPEEDFTIWVATNARSRKVAQVEADPRVTLTWFDKDGESYVTLLGSAQTVRDPRERERRWKDEWETFYEDRHRGDDYLLIRVRPIRLEIVSERHGMTNDPVTWRPVVVDLAGPR
jgi:general stress protein 26